MKNMLDRWSIVKQLLNRTNKSDENMTNEFPDYLMNLKIADVPELEEIRIAITRISILIRFPLI